MPKKAVKKQQRVSDDIRDLDLELPVDDDLDIVHNRSSRADLRKAYAAAGVDDDEHFGVLPGDAHDDGDEDEHETFDDMRDTARMAQAASRRHKAALDDDDFGIVGLEPQHEAEPKASSGRARDAARQGPAATSLEEVERDFAKLSTSQRLAMLKKESPEVLALMTELRNHLKDAQQQSETLKASRAFIKSTRDGNGSADRHELVDFLETKVTLLLTYCAHVTFYLLLKAEGVSVKSHPVVDRLVELRTYIEKLRPVEQRLSYSLNRLLSGQGSSAPNVAALRPVQGDDSEVFQANKRRVVDDDRAARRKAQQRADMQMAVDRQEEREMTRSRGKRITKDGDLELLQAADPGMEEEADHFLSGMMAGYDSDDDADNNNGSAPANKSLIDKLREKVSASAKAKLAQTTAKPRKAPKAAVDDDMADDDGEEGSDEGNEEDYEALLAEEYARDEQDTAARKAKQHRREQQAPENELERRQVNQKILSHRGLTKARPKDKKNPRVARRGKYDKGQKGAAAQGRGTRAENAGAFVGVPGIKTHVTHATRLS